MRPSWLERDRLAKPELNTLMHFMGSVERYSDLPWSARLGDIYYVKYEDMEYVWGEREWIALGLVY